MYFLKQYRPRRIVMKQAGGCPIIIARRHIKYPSTGPKADENMNPPTTVTIVDGAVVGTHKI
jgi:hypothetical protein